MPQNTTNYGWPYPLPADTVDVARDIKNLAIPIDASLKSLDSRLIDTGTVNLNPVTVPSTGFGLGSANIGRRIGPMCWMSGQIKRTGTAIAGTSNGNISDVLMFTVTDARFNPDGNLGGFWCCGISNNNGGVCGGMIVAGPNFGMYLCISQPNLAINQNEFLNFWAVYIGA